MPHTTPTTIDAYIASFPPDVQALLQAIRETIRDAAPDAEEAISYQIPTFMLNGRYLVYFAAYKKHIGVYPVPVGDSELSEALSGYTTGKGTARFPLDQPIPFDLLRKIVAFRLKESRAGAAKTRTKT